MLTPFKAVCVLLIFVACAVYWLPTVGICEGPPTSRFLPGAPEGWSDKAVTLRSVHKQHPRACADPVSPSPRRVISGVFELLGSILVGNNVAEAIRGRIINVSAVPKEGAGLSRIVSLFISTAALCLTLSSFCR